MSAAPDPVELVLAHVAASQRARGSRDPADWEDVRSRLAPDLVIRMAGPWGTDPWRVVLVGADALVERLKAPVNDGPSLATENVNVVRAGDDVLVEQLSTLTTEDGPRSSVVCHLFSVADGLITGIRAYRNDLGLPAG
ncbi:MAG: nuclear transport factor 2 family protein [Mycobacteriales bacterium]